MRMRRRAGKVVPIQALREFSGGSNNQFWLNGGKELEKKIVKDVMETDPRQGKDGDEPAN